MKKQASENAVSAAQEYIERQDRTIHPSGSFDKGGRWYPNVDEECDCCRQVRSPSRAYPYSYMLHCRTRAHVAALYGVSVQEINAALREIRGGRMSARACPEGMAYKVLAVENGRLVSVFDGSPWPLKQMRVETARQDHQGGLYVYETKEHALSAEFPLSAEKRDLPRVLVRVEVSGSYCRYGNKLAYSRVRPLTIVALL